MAEQTSSSPDDGPDVAETPGNAGDDRDRTAEDRDLRAEEHDQASEARDERAQARDERADAREKSVDALDTGAAADRVGALRDRRGGASDRAQAADDREAAAADRLLSARERASSSIDDLTGAYRRDAGTLELEREVARAKRTGRPMVLAFVDVDWLKETNDSRGHAAGDKRLSRTVESIGTHLRSYDLCVRFGGDEFVCGILDLNEADAAARFELVNADLAATDHGTITVGLAELRPEDSLESFLERADESLYRARGRRSRIDR